MLLILFTLPGLFNLYIYVSEGDISTIVLVLWMALAIIILADLLRFRFHGFAPTYDKDTAHIHE